MAQNSYKLTIAFEGGGNGTQKTPEQKAQEEAEKQKRRIASLVKTQVVKPFISSVENIYLNNLRTSTGSSQLAERQALLFDGVRQGINLYQSAVGGIAFASAVGLSSFAGGVIGVGLFALSTALNFAQRQNELNNQKKIEDLNITYQQSRRGFAFNKSRQGV